MGQSTETETLPALEQRVRRPVLRGQGDWRAGGEWEHSTRCSPISSEKRGLFFLKQQEAILKRFKAEGLGWSWGGEMIRIMFGTGHPVWKNELKGAGVAVVGPVQSCCCRPKKERCKHRPHG